MNLFEASEACFGTWQNKYSIILDQMLIIIHRMLINDEVSVRTMKDNDLNITNIPFKIT